MLTVKIKISYSKKPGIKVPGFFMLYSDEKKIYLSRNYPAYSSHPVTD